MNTKRSYLDSLNAGRQRRSGATFKEINRTLDQLESRLGGARDMRERKLEEAEEESDIARRMQRLSEAAARDESRKRFAPGADQGGDPSSRASLERIAREIESSRHQEDQLASIGGIADELKALREDMRAMMGSSLRREFHALRQELARIMAAVPQSPMTAELNTEFERLSQAIALLAERSDDKSIKVLRLELEQVKASLASLAREESVRSLDKRWDAFERRLSSGLGGETDPAIAGLSARLEEIGAAVNGLPESLSLRSLEERLRALAASLDQFAGQQDRSQPDLYAMIEERLDEISRAITASAALAHSPSFDGKLLERIEARISSLANQINELAEDRPDGMIADRLNTLTDRVDEIAERIEVPEQAVERLAGYIAQISEKLDTVPHSHEADHLFRGLEDRFTHLSDLMERRQEDVIQHSHSLFQDLERRLQDMAERLDWSGTAEGEAGIMAAIDTRFSELAARIEDARQEAGDGGILRSLEARLEDISGRLQNSASAGSGIDPEVIRNLEAQVASLSAHLARPGRDFPEFEDLAPRLENIERSISENRAAVLDAARLAAEQAIQAFGVVRAEPAEDGLKEELKTLETLTRKSEERNTKTFEAVHDTLLKIVERLGSLEAGGAAGKIAIGRAPPMDPAGDDREAEAEMPRSPEPKRTPAEAAAAAAEAALLDDDETSPPREGEKHSMLGGLSRALTGRRGRMEESVRGEPGRAEEPGDGTLGSALDAERINEPLEPGSGAPDLNAIMRRVRDEHGTREPASADTAKADFIAAARRAAQAAAAEAEILRNSRSEASSKSSKYGVGGFFGRRKKQLLLTLGAAIVIASGVQYGSTMLPDHLVPTLVAPLAGPAEEQQAAPIQATERQAAEPARAMERQAAAKRRPTGPEVEARAATPAQKADSRNSEGEVVATAAIDPSPAPVPTIGGDRRTANAILSPTPSTPLAAPRPQKVVPQEAADSANLRLPEIPAETGPAALRESAAEGNAAALYVIGTRYEEGHGVKADMDEAARWYEKAAEQGLAPAQYRVGNLYEKGMGVRRDLAKAKMWYQLAAEKGNARAMHNLGVLYAMGADGTTDNESAARWFLEGADRGIVDSQFNLGILAAKGVGIERDLGEAYKWLDIVARTGDTDAAAKRDEIAKAMAPADLVKAQGKAKLWKVKKPDPDANAVDVPEAWTEGGPITGSVDMTRAVGNIQVILNKNGYDAGPADGVMGERTRVAIRNFQKENGMAETGEIDDALVRALLARNEAAQ